MKLTPEIYAGALFSAIQETVPKDHDRVLDNFVKLLAAHGSLSLYGRIEEAYRRLTTEQEGKRHATVTTAHELKLDAETLEALNRAASSKLEAEHKTDPQLIGGVVLKTGDLLVDGSLKNQLEKLRDQLTK